jgi:pyruvate kinase
MTRDTSPATASRRRTKLVCTIGPATEHRMDELERAGMDVARINFSHGTAATRRTAARAVRQTEAASGRPVGILIDLAGPKIRLGDVAGGSIELEAGRPFALRAFRKGEPPGNATGAHVSYAGLAADVQVGDRVLLADGAAELRVTGIAGGVETEVVRGGTVRSRTGVAIPADRLSSPALTAKDRADLPLAIELGADLIGQSFVRGPDDIRALRALLGPDGPHIVAKIETRPAVESFDAILDVVDSVMIARGDLGVEVPYEEVPLIQKQLVRRALDRGIPSIVATQMLESMTSSPRPTRAEASDVANAVFDGADAIMLSGETAIGAYPVLAAEAAARIALRCEIGGASQLPAGMAPSQATDVGALAYAAAALVTADVSIEAIACYTRTGRTARILSALRPGVPIVAFSPDPHVAGRLAVAHGVFARTCAPLAESSDRIGELDSLLREAQVLPTDASVVFVTSTGTPGSAPDVLAVRHVPADVGRRSTGRGRPTDA